MKEREALKLALDALEAWETGCGTTEYLALVEKAVTAIKEALAQPEQEPVAVKHMMEWVDYLKRKSDYGQHLQIPSEMSAGACWDLARELEQFINTTPPQRTWVGLTEQEHTDIAVECGCMSADWVFYGATVERKLKEKNS